MRHTVDVINSRYERMLYVKFIMCHNFKKKKTKKCVYRGQKTVFDVVYEEMSI